MPMYQEHCVVGLRRLFVVFEGNLTNLTSPYSLHHPKIGYWPYKMNRHEQIQIVSSKTSMNWALGDKRVEVLYASTGRTETEGTSRISKKALYSAFLRLSKTSSQITYKQAKAQSKEYQLSKKKWIEIMSKSYDTSWPLKPPEVENFPGKCRVSFRFMNPNISWNNDDNIDNNSDIVV
mmetsp:Transcript_9839/g.14488  ORF Transcript_9839/g.14488 Transcript_9839/m.14488 type:complete len:178 (+) Transcript_9839:310-843(+)